jgi:hypothetical protein
MLRSLRNDSVALKNAPYVLTQTLLFRFCPHSEGREIRFLVSLQAARLILHLVSPLFEHANSHVQSSHAQRCTRRGQVVCVCEARKARGRGWCISEFLSPPPVRRIMRERFVTHAYLNGNDAAPRIIRPNRRFNLRTCAAPDRLLVTDTGACKLLPAHYAAHGQFIFWP